MKRMIVLFLLCVSMFGNTLFANDRNKISSEAKEAFDKRFPNARAVVWHQLKNANIYQVYFIYNNQQLIGYIEMEGAVVGLARSVMNEKLPFLVTEAIAKKYLDYTIKTGEEFITGDEVSYLFTLENEKHRIYTRIYSNGDVSVIRKIKK